MKRPAFGSSVLTGPISTDSATLQTLGAEEVTLWGGAGELKALLPTVKQRR